MAQRVAIGIEAPTGSLPQYSTEGSSGLDLRANLEAPFVLAPGARALIPTGIRLRIPAGYEGQIRSRSGLAANAGVLVLNSPGTIDSDYRGELKVILANLGDQDFPVAPGDRVAQLVFCPVVKVDFVPEAVGNDSVRGDGGFGHTGIK